MKVAVLSSFTTSLFWFRLDMMRAFIKAGYDVIAVGDGIETEWTEKFALEGIRYKQIPVQRNGTNPIKDIDTIRALIKLLNDEKPDKIFAYQAKTVCYGGFAARVTKINEFYPLIAGLGSVFLGNGIKNRLLKTILVLEYKIGMKKAPGYFFQNQDDLKVFVDNKIVDPAKVTMIHGSGVNIEKFARTPLPENPTFLCISRLIRDKGVFEYLEACRLLKNSYPNVRCMLIGPFDTNPSALTKNDLQSYIDDGSVEYLGEQKDVYPFIAQASVYVLPSYHEGTPKSVLEAMSCGRAIITTDAPGCRETVTNGVNGFLVPIKDVQSIVIAMEKMIKNPQLVSDMATNGRNLAETKFDVNLVNKTIMQTMGIV